MNLNDYIKLIEPVDCSITEQAQKRWDSIAKPLKSLGKLETAVNRIAAITGERGKIDVSKAALLVMCADHGVVAEGVTQTDSTVTKIVTDSFQNSETTVTVMSKVNGVDVFPVDVGIDCEKYENKELKPFTVADRKVKRGTNDILFEDAMTREECKKAIVVGIECVSKLKEKGYKIIATGEMGIGNTTPTSVLSGMILNLSAEKITGKGAGLSKEGIKRKTEVVEKTIERIEKKYKKDDILGILSSGGGLEIAAMTGIFIGGAVYKIPVIADGVISTLSAVIAKEIAPCGEYIFASHISAEPAGRILNEKLGADTYIDCNMCLGEGTGAVAVIPILKTAVEVYNSMSTFSDFKMESYKDFEKER